MRANVFMSWKVLRNSAMMLGLFVVLLLTSNCVPTPKKYCIRRTALVPVPSPSMRSASMSKSRLEGSVGMDTVLAAFTPQRLEGRNVGLYIPRFQFAGNLMVGILPELRMGFSWEAGLSEMSVPIAPGLIRPPQGAIGGGGLRIATTFKVHSRVTIDMGCDFWLYNIRSNIQYSECEGSGGRVGNNWRSKTSSVVIPMIRFQSAVGIDLNWSHLTFGVGGRTQPHNTDATVEVLHTPGEITPQLNTTFYPYAFVSWEFHISDWAHLSASVYQPLLFDPVIFAPILGFQFRIAPPDPSMSRKRHTADYSDVPERYRKYEEEI